MVWLLWCIWCKSYPLPNLQDLYISRVTKRAKKVTLDPSHTSSLPLWTVAPWLTLQITEHQNSQIQEQFSPQTISHLNNTWMNEWMMHLYSALLCIVVYPKHFTIRSLLNHHQCAASTWMMWRLPQKQQRQCARHTPATGGEEKSVIEPIKWMGIIRRPWLTRASGGNLARTPGLLPYLFMRSVMGFLMTTESQDLGLTSHPKDGAFWQYSVPVSILGC